jgi:hypothetical protein
MPGLFDALFHDLPGGGAGSDWFTLLDRASERHVPFEGGFCRQWGRHVVSYASLQDLGDRGCETGEHLVAGRFEHERVECDVHLEELGTVGVAGYPQPGCQPHE